MKRMLFTAVLITATLFAQHDTATVAAVGRYTISAADLMTSYEFGPAFVQRRTDPLRAHLTFMIYERLLALEAERTGLNTAEFVRDRITALEEDGAVEELYRQEILSRVDLTEEQIAADTRNAKITVSLRWIFSPSREIAERTAAAVANGASFDSLYTMQFDSTMEGGSRSLETTLLKLERDNQELAQNIHSLRPGMISAPVAGKDGYYIIRLDRAEQNPLTTESEYTMLRNQAVEIRTELIANGLSDQYVKTMMKSYDPVIKADGFNILRAYLADKGLSRDTKVKWDIPSTFMTEAGPQPVRNAGKYLNRTLATFGGRSITIREYAKWYDIRQFQFDTRSLEAFNSSVKKTIWKMVQDRLLSEEAYRRGLDRVPAVANETKKWEAKMLYLAQRAALSRTINTSDSVLQRFYRKNILKYRNAAGSDMPFADVREAVKTDYAGVEESLLLQKSVEALKQRFVVTINEPLLRQLSENVRTDASAIETVFYKPGGTFPRVAFPTIDEAWGALR
jgi:hypothetical protein